MTDPIEMIAENSDDDLSVDLLDDTALDRPYMPTTASGGFGCCSVTCFVDQ